MKRWRTAIAYVSAGALAAVVVAMPLVPLWHSWFITIGGFNDYASKTVSLIADILRREGPAAAASAVRVHANELPKGRFILFADSRKQVLAGTLREWPQAVVDERGSPPAIPDKQLREFRVAVMLDGEKVSLRIAHEILPGGYRLLMARKSVPLSETRNQLFYGSASSLALFILFGAVAAWLLGRRATALRLSEERHALAMRASGEGHWHWRIDRDEFYASPRYLEIGGFPPDFKYAKRADVVDRLAFHPDDKPKYEAAVAAHFAGETPRMDIVIRVLPKGEVRWLHVIGMCSRDAAGMPVSWAGSVNDITERKNAELALSASEGRYALAMEAAGDGHTDWNLVTGEHYISPRLLEICGHAPGTTFRDREEWVRRFPFHPEDRPRWERAVAAHFAGRESNFKMELRIVVRGEVRWTVFHFLSARDAAGTVVRWTGSIGDITEQKRTEEGLRQQTERLQLGQAAARMIVMDWNIREDTISWSDSPEWLRGPLPASGRYPLFKEQVHPEDRASFLVTRNRALETLQGHTQEFRLVRTDGTVIWVMSRQRVFAGEDGKAARMLAAMFDNTERKRAEEALRESQERYALAVAGASDGIWDEDLATGMLYRSPRNQEMALGRPSDGIDVRSRAEWAQWHHVHPDDAPKRDAMRRAHLEGRTPLYEVEYRVRHPDGTHHWIHARGVCTRDASGRPLRFAGSTTNIDARKAAEEALHASEERYALAVAGSDDGIWDVDFATRRVFISARTRELTGMPPGPDNVPFEEGFDCLTLHPEDISRRALAIQAHLEGTTPAYVGEFRLRQPDGVYRWRRLHGLCSRDADGKPRRMAGSISDIDARRRAEDALRLSEERYAHAMEASEEGHFDWNVQTDEIFASGRLKKILALPADLEYRTREDMVSHMSFHDGDRERLGEMTREVLAGSALDHAFEYRLRRGEAEEVRWIQVRWKIFRGADGAAQRVIGVVSDITERKLAVDTLAESEERFRSVIESAPVAIALANPRGLSLSGVQRPAHVLQINREFTRIFGFTAEDIVGKQLGALLAPGDLNEGYAANAGSMVAGNKVETEVVRQRKDGSRVLVHLTGVPVRLSDATTCTLLMYRDLTERELATKVLRESEARFRAIAELSSEGYWEQDENLRYIPAPSAVRADIAGYATDERIGKTRWELSPEPMPLSGNWDEHKAVLAARVPFRDFQYRRVRPDGEIGYYSVSGVPVFDEQNRFKGYFGVVSDITARKRFEEELRESEARFRALTELSSDWYWAQDENLRFTYLSDQAGDLTGYSGESSLGKTRWEIDNMVPLNSTWAEHQAVLAAHRPFRDLETRRTGPDGTVRYLSISGAPMFDENGRFKGYQGIGRNITERKRAEEALRRSEAALRLSDERYALAMEASEEGHWDYNIETGELFISDRLNEIYGFPPGERFHRRNEFISRVPFYAEDAGKYHDAVRSAEAKGGPERYEFDFRILRPSGEIGWLRTRAKVIRDAEGRAIRRIGVIADITPSKLAADELRKSEERFALAVEGSNEGIFDWDLVSDKVYVSYRAQELFGVPRGDLWRPRRDWRHILTFHPDDAPRLHDRIKAHIEGNEPTYDVEFRIVVTDGGVRWFRQRGIALRDASGKAYRVVGSIGDVTEAHKAEEELGRLERRLRMAQRLEAMGTLAGGIAHDFNNILGAILGYGEMAVHDAKNGSRLRRDLDSIMAAGERGRALIDRVLAFSRSGVGERVPVHVEAVVREAIDQIAAKLPGNVTLRPQLRAGRAAMLGDSTQVHQVVMNLATNAVQAMPDGGIVRVALATLRQDEARPATVGSLVPGNYVILTVGDTGTGIPADVLERMFDPFFTTKEVGVGSGLGLSLVHGIVTNVEGAIDVATKPGKGTTFTVYLRRSGDVPEKDRPRRPASGKQKLPRGAGQRVLVVDDEEPLVRLATETLERLGYAPVGFTSSAAALAAFRADPSQFDAVLTDERMPGMSGTLLIREVRGIRSTIPIVMMSGYPRMDGVNADVVVRKPLSAGDLAASMARALNA